MLNYIGLIIKTVFLLFTDNKLPSVQHSGAVYQEYAATNNHNVPLSDTSHLHKTEPYWKTERRIKSFRNHYAVVSLCYTGIHVRRQKDKCVFLLYVDANSVVNSKGPTNTTTGSVTSGAALSGGMSMEFTVKELYAIEEIHSEPNLLRLITGSVTAR